MKNRISSLSFKIEDPDKIQVRKISDDRYLIIFLDCPMTIEITGDALELIYYNASKAKRRDI